MNITKSAYVQIRKQIFEALDAEAVQSLSSEALAQQLSSAVDVLIEKFGLSVTTMIRREYVKSLLDELQGWGHCNL